MAITVVNPPQQQQGQGMNQWMTLLEGRNERLKQLNEIEMENFGNAVTGMAAERGGWANILADEGGEDVIREYLDKTMGLKPEKVDSYVNMLRSGVTPREMQYATDREMYMRGLAPGQGQGQAPPPPQVQQPVQGAPVTNQAGGAFVPLEGQVAKPGVGVEGADVIGTSSDGSWNYGGGGTSRSITFPPGQTWTKPEEGSQETTPPSQIIAEGFKGLSGPRRRAARQELLNRNPALQEEFDKLLQANPAPPLGSNPGASEQHKNELVQQAADNVTAGVPMRGNSDFAQVQTVVQTIQDSPELYYKKDENGEVVLGKDGQPQFQYARAASDIIRVNKNLFPDGTIPSPDKMNPAQKKFYNEMTGTLGTERGFYLGDQETVMQGIMKVYNTVGSDVALEPNSTQTISEGKQRAAVKQATTRATTAIKKTPEFRTIEDLRAASDEDILARRAYIDQLWADNPQMAGTLDPRGLASRTQNVENKYKEALTNFSLMQTSLMAMQAQMAQEATPEILQGQVGIDLIMKFMAEPTLFDKMPQVGELVKGVTTNLFNSLFNTGVSAETVQKMFAFFATNKLTTKFTAGGSGGAVQFTAQDQALLGELAGAIQ